MKKVSTWRELTLREKIGQTVILLSHPDKHIAKGGSIEKFLERYPIGGLHCSGSEVKGFHMEANMKFPEVVAEYNKHLRVPLVGVADNGYFATTHKIEFPIQMSLGAADDPELAYRTGEFRAEDCKLSGINWCFWPNADMPLSMHNPASGTRGTSDDPDLVYRMVREQLRAMKEHGVIPCIKHFPGSVNDCYVDLHLASLDSKFTREEWNATAGEVYRRLFAEYAPSIMVGHHAIPSLQSDDVNGEYPPATLSYDLTTKVLREELGFRGVTVTDALIMGGFVGKDPVDAAVRSFMAGNDVLLWPEVEYIDEMERRILADEIAIERLDEAVERIWNLKKESGVLDGTVAPPADVDEEFFRDITRAVTEAGLTLVSDDDHLLPIDRERVKRVQIVGVTPDDREYEILTGLVRAFEKYGIEAKIRRNGWTTALAPLLEECDLMLFAISRNVHRPMGPLDFWGSEASTIWASNSLPKGKLMVACFGTPYLYRYYHKSRLPYVNAYSCSEEAVYALVRAIVGEIPFRGKNPVKHLI